MILWDGQECELRDLKRVWQSDYKPTFVTRLVHGKMVPLSRPRKEKNA